MPTSGLPAARLVVQTRWTPPADPDTSDAEREGQWTALAGPLFERATALGGRIIGWGERFITVDFSWDALYDAVDFLVDAPLLPELASGMCHGEVCVVHESPRIAVATGEPLYRVTLLTELARPGEILVDPALIIATGGRLGSAGAAGKRPGRPDVPAEILDPNSPLEEDAHSEIPASVRARSSWPVPGQIGALTGEGKALRAELEADQVERLAGATEAVQRESISTFPEALAAALRERSPEALRELSERANVGPKTSASQRLSAMAQLVSGQGGEAIRRLREAEQEAEQEAPEVRCRAALALAVALAAVGRNQEAVLQALSGLARAREASDKKGERACARLLASLAQASGDASSSAVWEHLCEVPSEGA